MEIETRITLDQFGEDRANIVMLSSHEFYNIVNRANAALGRQPERIASMANNIAVNGIPLRKDLMLGQNIKVKFVHKTLAVDLSNI